MIANCRRTATVKALNYTMCAQLKKEHFYDMCRRFPDVLNSLKQGIYEY